MDARKELRGSPKEPPAPGPPEMLLALLAHGGAARKGNPEGEQLSLRGRLGCSGKRPWVRTKQAARRRRRVSAQGLDGCWARETAAGREQMDGSMGEALRAWLGLLAGLL